MNTNTQTRQGGWRLLRPMMLLISLTGCSKMAIDGQVVDATGAPLPDALVTAVGNPCQVKADQDGQFALSCAPGEYLLSVSLEGYTSTEMEISAVEKKRYDIGETVLVKIPDSKGLFVAEGNEYRAMEPARVMRTITKTSKGYDRMFCLNADESTQIALLPGENKFFDYEHEGWRIFQLDSEGCAYKDTKDSKHRWTVTYREKPEIQETEINRGKKVVTIDLPAGEYFIADWQGFFQPIRKAKLAYSGHWLKVGK